MNRGEALASHYVLQIALPTVVGAVKLHKEGLIQEQRDDRKFWRVLLRPADNLPLFPNSDTIVKEEIPSKHEQATEPAGDKMSCVLFADEMPAIRRDVEIEEALKGWV